MIRSVVVASAVLLAGCAMQRGQQIPVRLLPDQVYRDPAGSAYLWTSGRSRQSALSLPDWATLTRIDADAMPAAYLPGAGSEPVLAWLVEIPAGKHVLEILDKEATPLCYLSCITVEKSRRTIELIAEPGRTYTPYLGERCSRKWYWIADSGPYVPGSRTQNPVVPPKEPMPVVAGAAPTDAPCASGSRP